MLCGRYLGLQKTRDYHGTVEFKLGGKIYFQANPNLEIQTKIGMIESSFGMIPVLGRYVESSVWDKTSDWDLLFLVLGRNHLNGTAGCQPYQQPMKP